MQLRLPRSLYRFCIGKFNSAQQKARFLQKVKNDPYQVFKKLQYNNSNHRQTLDNFKTYKNDQVYLDRCEIQTRIMKRLYNSQLVDLKKFSFDQDLREDLKMDSLNIVVILTQIEHEFTTVFEDRVFQSARKLSDFVDILARDDKIF